MTFCGACGTQLTLSSKYCSNCGKATSTPEESPIEPNTNHNAQSYGNSPNNSSSSANVDNFEEEENDIIEYEAKYLGGHSSFPGKKAIDTDVIIYDNILEVKRLSLKIPYSSMTNVHNMDVEKISALRVIGLGLIFLPLAIVGAMWKKKKLYTVIQYHDGFQEQALVFDFREYMEEVQSLVYRKMVEHRINRGH